MWGPPSPRKTGAKEEPLELHCWWWALPLRHCGRMAPPLKNSSFFEELAEMVSVSLQRCREVDFRGPLGHSLSLTSTAWQRYQRWSWCCSFEKIFFKISRQTSNYRPWLLQTVPDTQLHSNCFMDTKNNPHVHMHTSCLSYSITTGTTCLHKMTLGVSPAILNSP